MNYKVGDRVIVSINFWGLVQLKGTIFYIDNQNLYNHEFLPIQVELDEPWTEHGQRMIRVSLKEVKLIKEESI